MVMLTSATVAHRPQLAEEVLPVEALGGDVIVRELPLSARLELRAQHARLAEPLPGESDDIAHTRAGAFMMPATLARCVFGGDGLPLFTLDEWDAFGTRHTDAALALFKASQRLSGMTTEAAEKN